MALSNATATRLLVHVLPLFPFGLSCWNRNGQPRDNKLSVANGSAAR